MAELDFWQLLNLIGTEFPQYVPILEKPGIFDVFARYAQAKSSGVNPWTSDQLLAELHKTPYYQTSTDKVRQWHMLQVTDPATAGARATDTKRVFDDLQKQLGITLDTSGGFAGPSFQLFQRAVSEEWDANRIKYELIAAQSGQSGGEVGNAATQVRGLANDYGVPLSDQRVMQYANQLTQGAIDQNGLTGDLVTQAKSLFPSIAADLDRGVTVKQYFDPYLQIAQQELGVNPADINLTDQKWMRAINQVDPKTNQRVPMSMDQWLATVRQDPSYGYDQTSKARNDATQLTGQLAHVFGAAA